MKKLWSYIAIPCTALAVFTGSIAWVLLLRPFYYAQIGPLGICESSGLTAAQVRAAYGDVMDYCLGLRQDFAAGVLPFSAEGASHFADVRVLFILDLAVLAVTVIFLLGLRIVCKRRGEALPRLGGRTPAFWAACGLGGLILLVGALAATDFDRAFTVFHGIFFPGKDNWLFDPATDPVIVLLPAGAVPAAAIHRTQAKKIKRFFGALQKKYPRPCVVLCFGIGLTARWAANRSLRRSCRPDRPGSSCSS